MWYSNFFWLRQAHHKATYHPKFTPIKRLRLGDASWLVQWNFTITLTKVKFFPKVTLIWHPTHQLNCITQAKRSGRQLKIGLPLPKMFTWICNMNKAMDSDNHSIKPPNLQLGSMQRVGKCLTWASMTSSLKFLCNPNTQKLFQKLALSWNSIYAHGCCC